MKANCDAQRKEHEENEGTTKPKKGKWKKP